MSGHTSTKTTPLHSPLVSKSSSFLANDGIDQLKPLTRKQRVSSLSLSDQWSHSALSSLTQLRISPKTEITHKRVANYAFAFDIDGVIVRGPQTIPEASQALKMLNGNNKYNITVPYIFVTNGGGRSEQARCDDLTRRLGVEVTKDQVIQGHTPMKDLVDIHKHVLVVGGIGDSCRNVAIEYGFEHVYTPLDVMKWSPSVTPYHNLTPEELAVAQDHDFSKIPIDGILVFADSRNWAADQQIILDLLMSKHGFMGTRSETFDEGPSIYFAHSDFVWSTDYGQSRYGMGALQVSIAALYREHTGLEFNPVRFGKPQRGTFKFADKVLTNWRKDVLEENLPGADNKNSSSVFDSSSESEDDDDDDEDDQPLTFNSMKTIPKLQLQLPPASTVYFVGDTPESDIRFANSHDASWHSILVKTGVYQDGSIPKYKPKYVCENVLEAVKYAIEREHAMELKEWNERYASSSPPPQPVSKASSVLAAD